MPIGSIKNRLTLKSNAKINLVLSVYGKTDNGYHDISSVMQTVDLCDKITIAEHDLISVTSDFAPVGEKNICYKAAKYFSRYGGARIHIEKNIPMAAGLGGGSSNAAAVLLGLNRIFGNPYTDEKLKSIALTLGADVPLFLEGGTMRADGVGEKLLKTRELDCYVVIVKSGEKSSTGEMYSKLDKKGLVDNRAQVSEFIKALDNKDISKASALLFNDFEKVCPCEEIKNNLIENGALGACLSGSGPSVFGLFEDLASAKRAKETLEEKYREVFVCKTANKGIIFE